MPERALGGVVVGPNDLLHPRSEVRAVGRLGHVRIPRALHQAGLALEAEDLADELRSLLGQRVAVDRAPHLPDCRLDVRKPGAQRELHLAFEQHLRELERALPVGEDVPIPHHLAAAVLRAGATADASQRAVLVGQCDQRRVNDGEGGAHQAGWCSMWKLRTTAPRASPPTTLVDSSRNTVPAATLAASLLSVRSSPAAAVMAPTLVPVA